MRGKLDIVGYRWLSLVIADDGSGSDSVLRLNFALNSAKAKI
jgi:hypothetical protein